MATLSQFNKSEMRTLERRFQKAIHAASALEVAAQTYARTVYEPLRDSIVLLRVFVTMPFEALPAENQAFVRSLSESAGIGGQISADTLVLSLLGTMGLESAWCDRRNSANHIGIPLVSHDFIAEIPMISRMLKQFGVNLDWIDRKDKAVFGTTFGTQSGVFYVDDAATAVDGQGRKIIPAQDFVERYGIKTVYGIGGGYLGTPVYATIIAFCRDSIEGERVETFRSHIDRFKVETESLVQAGRIFGS